MALLSHAAHPLTHCSVISLTHRTRRCAVSTQQSASAIREGREDAEGLHAGAASLKAPDFSTAPFLLEGIRTTEQDSLSCEFRGHKSKGKKQRKQDVRGYSYQREARAVNFLRERCIRDHPSRLHYPRLDVICHLLWDQLVHALANPLFHLLQ